MQLANLAIGAAAALVFFRTAPFGLAARLLFVFSYYALFEFSVIARSYALELLLLFSVLCPQQRQRAGPDRVGPAPACSCCWPTRTCSERSPWCRSSRPRRWDALVSLPPEGRGARLRARLPALGLAGAGAVLGFAHVLAQSLAIGPDHADAYRPAYDLDWFLGLHLGALRSEHCPSRI